MAIINNPHPLLDNNKGNFEDFHFEVEIIKCAVSEGLYQFHFKAEIDEENITNLIDDKKALFAVKIENKPYYCEVFKSHYENPYEVVVDIEFEKVSSDFSFEITPLILTSSAIEYNNPNADYPMCDYSFSLLANQIIGSHSPLKLSFERGYRKISSGPLIKVVKLAPPNKPYAGTMDISLNDDDCIQVRLSEETYNKFIALNRKEPKLLDALITLPVLQHTLSELLLNNDLREKSWAKVLDEEYDIFELTNQEAILKKCDQILKRSIPNFIDYFENKYLAN
ncbi:MAG: hypothetical protein RL263_1153 [Bacteroidota bacterium]|jgi:hypothetical protein